MLAVIDRPDMEPPLPDSAAATFDWTARLSLDAIRTHTKTDDVPGVTDEQLQLYRAAAIEAAEKYSGLLLSGQRTITEPIQGPRHPKPGKLTYKYRLQYPSADGVVWIYGGDHNGRHGFHVTPGSRTIEVPIRTGFIDLSNCCDPCSSHHLNSGMMATYKAGFACTDDVPACVVLGCLMYIGSGRPGLASWIKHDGYRLIIQREGKRVSPTL